MGCRRFAAALFSRGFDKTAIPRFNRGRKMKKGELPPGG